MAGKGSIEKRSKDSWRLSYSSGINISGKRVKHTKTIKASSKREAEKELALFVAEIEKGLYLAPSKLTFSEYADVWLENHVKINLAPTSIEYYERLMKRITFAFGHLKLEQIKPLHLTQFYKNLQEDGVRGDGKSGGLSPRMIHHYHRCLSKMFNDAVAWELILDNPAKKIKAPKVEAKESEFYTVEEVAQILEKLSELSKEEFKYQLVITLAIATGARKGEIMGLEWKHIDFHEKTMSITQNSQYTVKTGTITKATKNASSRRKIALPDSIIDILREYKAYQANMRFKLGSKWHDYDRLFTQFNGKPMHPSTCNSWFKKFLKKHGLPEKTFHSLRHTSATLLIAEGINIRSLAKRLGHARTDTTLNIYSHALESVDRVAAEKMDQLLFQNNGVKNSGRKKA